MTDMKYTSYIIPEEIYRSNIKITLNNKKKYHC